MASVLSIINFLILMTVGVFQTLLAVCPHGWLAWQDTCYILLPDRMDWWQAKEVCDRPGSSMVVPGSQEEHDFIWRVMKVWMADYGATRFDDFEVWIGCSVVDTDNVSISCVSSVRQGDAIYTKWGRRQPDGKNGECVRMTNKFGGQWADLPCSYSKYAACEMRVSRVSFCKPTDADGQCLPHCLLNHGIKNLTTTGVTRCASACWEEPRCHSFNHWQRKKADVGVCHCQLNSATRLQAAIKDYKNVEDCYFYEM